MSAIDKDIPLVDLLADVRACRHCEEILPLGPRPMVRASETARILIVGQAPGTKVHESGIPWNDPSGNRLRDWLQLEPEVFYDDSQIAIVPMGFCYPGKGKSGDLPPAPDCAPKWHPDLLARMPQVELTILIGNYAQNRYLESAGETLTERVGRWRDFGPGYIPLPHPSPRNTLWLKRNPWFEAEVIPSLRKRVREILFR